MRGFTILCVTVLSLFFVAGAMAAGGEAIYQAKCLMCHGPGGAGTPMAPAFKGNDFVRKTPKKKLAAMTKKGIAGADKRYKKFAMPMPAQNLTDAELSAVVDYIKGLAK